MKRALAITLTVAGLIAVSCRQTGSSAQKGEATYKTLEVGLSDITLATEYSAAISGVQTVEIRPQVSGMITDILIEEGENVRKGQVLFVIDCRARLSKQQGPVRAGCSVGIRPHDCTELPYRCKGTSGALQGGRS